MGAAARVDAEDLIGNAERKSSGGTGRTTDDQVARKGHGIEGDLTPRCAGVPVERAAVDISDEGETATGAHRRRGFRRGGSCRHRGRGCGGRCRW